MTATGVGSFFSVEGDTRFARSLSLPLGKEESILCISAGLSIMDKSAYGAIWGKSAYGDFGFLVRFLPSAGFTILVLSVCGVSNTVVTHSNFPCATFLRVRWI